MPSNSTDRLNGLTTSVAIKAPCKYATTGNITLSGLGTQAGGPWLTSLSETDGDGFTRVFVWQQDDPIENGIYNPKASGWQRAKDFDGSRDAVQGTLVPVYPATVGTLFYELQTANPVLIGASEIVFLPADAGLDTLASAEGASLVGNEYDAPQAVAFNLHDWIEDDGSYNLMGFVPQASKAAIRDRTSTTDLSAAANLCVAAIASERANGGAMRLPMGQVTIEAPVEGAAGVSIFGFGPGSSVIRADDCAAITLDFLSSFGNVMLDNFGIEGTNGATRIGIYQAGTLDDADELYGLTVSRLLLRGFNVGMQFRTLRNFTLDNIWMQDVNSGVKLVGKCLAGVLKNMRIVRASGPGAGTRYGILVDSFNYTSGAGVVAPEGLRIRDPYIQGFEYCFDGVLGNEIRIENPDVAGTIVPIRFSGLTSFSIERGYVQGIGANLQFGIHGVAQGAVNNSKYSIRDVNVNAVSAPANASGIMLGTRAVSGNVDGVTIEGCEFSGWTGYDIEQYTCGNNIIRGNRCGSSGTTQSVSVTACPVNRPTYVEQNQCAKAITYDAADFNSGVLQLGTNVINGTTLNHGMAAPTTPTFSSGDFTASGAMTWTVAAGDVSNYTYSFDGKFMKLKVYLVSTTVGGVASNVLYVKVPAGRTITKSTANSCIVLDNGTRATAYLTAVAGATVVEVRRSDNANFALATDNTFVLGEIEFEVN
jgi:hypothetical protein